MPYEKLDLSTPKPVLSWANHSLAAQETQMAKNVASLPFVFKHVALMPDVHLGKGSLVGSVIATKDAILPAAVGVDIGCFTGDTLVPLVDGKSYTLEALASSQREIIVYSCTQTGKIVAAKATAKLTRRNQLLLKVVLDNSQEIKCTLDHRFMLRDGSYLEARDLKPGTSLMPFYSQTDKDGYTLIQQPYSGRWQKADGIISATDIPTTDIPATEWLESQLSGRVPSFPGHRTVIDHHIDHHNVDPAEHRSSNLVGGANHKVVKILPVQERQDVYCLTVPEYHNFALTAGVFVHNCGMSAIKTPFVAEQLEGKLKKIRLEIEAAIPVGFNENKDIEKPVVNWQGWRDFKELHPGVQRLDGKSMKQLGSLGGGNHFIELCLDTENQVWLMLHSGSRHIGNQLAKCHINTAKELAKLAHTKLPDRDLAYFVAGTPEFAAYWRDLQWAQNYARYNRDIMMARFKRIVEKHLAGGKSFKPLLSVNCHHNYAEKEMHFSEEVYVTRKGAVRARTDDYGIIPGSMGAKSFIVKGKGNHDSYCSCAHGAGRLMSRTKAKKQFTIDDLVEQTKGVECRKDKDVIDEIPGAYKPIDQVMANQSDLVEVVATLKQVVCVKG
ncbi:RtcB family protein [Moorena bouillonii]|uniref:3'-phosphate/5'-hydroxy nucleic acid ligase n=1 Tax=Moorena bouillonii PNG TaxID=568701 RepID=A0A1U7MVH5_9CYAN|nr:RtcB family protein [Moorena bouillonii]OLT57686.1 RNA-splicing ligase RtcB [Moorena bouillonii PNG]